MDVFWSIENEKIWKWSKIWEKKLAQLQPTSIMIGYSTKILINRHWHRQNGVSPQLVIGSHLFHLILTVFKIVSLYWLRKSKLKNNGFFHWDCYFWSLYTHSISIKYHHHPYQYRLLCVYMKLVSLSCQLGQILHICW